jgi:mono/diheme cytochrome c family protein
MTNWEDASMQAAMGSAIAFALSVLGFSGPLLAEGDPLAGRETAQEWCARCHDIERGGQWKQDPPAFAAIAAFRSPEYIHANITFPHQRMPEMAQILGLDVDDLVAYILSLEEPCD